VLFTPARHEALGDRPFSEATAREAIAHIAARAKHELDAVDGLWPRDPADALRPGEGRACSLYWGAAGVSWALEELADDG